jgi:hypothetical protein
MKFIRFQNVCVTLAFTTFAQIPYAHAQSLPLDKPLASEDLGFGPGIVIEEVARKPEQSQFKIVRKYDYTKDPSIAWGTPHNWFVLCALQTIGSRRSFTRLRMTYEVIDNGKIRTMQGGETSIGPQQLYVLVDWLSGTTADAAASLAQGIVPFNEQLSKMCEKFKLNAAVPAS